MTREKSAMKYVQGERNEKGLLVAKGVLKNGLKVGNIVHQEFEMREAVMEDLFAAEQHVDPRNLLQFNSAIWCRTLVRLGTLEGPFTVAMLGKLKQVDYSILRDAQLEIDVLGEAE